MRIGRYSRKGCVTTAIGSEDDADDAVYGEPDFTADPNDPTQSGMAGMTDKEKAQTLYDALRRIARYSAPERLRTRCEKDYGLGYHEALEYAYENVLQDAKSATHAMRRP